MNLLMHPKFLLVAFATTTIASTTEATGVPTSFAVARSVASNIDSVHEKRENVHRLLTAIQGVQGDTGEKLTTPAFKKSRHLDESNACDTKFMDCLPNKTCMDCFEELAIQKIDWAGVTVATTCSDVVKFLTASGHCTSLEGDAVATTTFCDTFDACVIFDDEDEDDDDGLIYNDDGDFLDCSTLTKCAWDGMHQNWIGDGVCHDNMYGCYNTAVCGYDGGDCCEDTCGESFSNYVECGHEGYSCRDPMSDNCNRDLTADCPNNANGGGSDATDVKCEEDETMYRLVMYDSFGDGWDRTTLTIQVDGTRTNLPADVIFKGGLVEGFEGTEYICLSKSPLCYNAKTEGGTWGVEVSWEIRQLPPGFPSVAGGGAPGNCDFSFAGEICPNTCENTKPNVAPADDPDYSDLKDLYECIEKKCVIQLGACLDDEECEKCFDLEEEPDRYCYGIDTFMATVDCTLCSCTDQTGSVYCYDKSGPGQVIPPPTPKGGDENIVKQCTPRETIDGTSAIMDYSSCANLDSVSLLITEFDQNNFGQLDSFEMCAHQFKDKANQRTALECMKILKDTITNPTTDKNAPAEAISALAKDLYDNAGDFCDCTRKASNACPLCPSFMNFKTILYESIDACESLDAIDCDAWNEFWEPCSDNLKTEYRNWSDFTNTLECEFVKDGCGNAGTFPAFRRLDCEEEVPEEAWTFYKQFAKGCLRGADGIAPTDPPRPTTPTTPAPKPKPTPAPNPVPVPTPTDPGDKRTPKPYIPADDDNSTPYVPSSDDEEKKESKSHWFRNMFVFSVLAGLGYYVYKKRFDGFNFMQYRRRTFGRGAGFDYGMVSSSGAGENEMYGNLNSSTTFEPPTLPPTPQMMVNGPYNAP